MFTCIVFLTGFFFWIIDPYETDWWKTATNKKILWLNYFNLVNAHLVGNFWREKTRQSSTVIESAAGEPNAVKICIIIAYFYSIWEAVYHWQKHDMPKSIYLKVSKCGSIHTTHSRLERNETFSWISKTKTHGSCQSGLFLEGKIRKIIKFHCK